MNTRPIVPMRAIQVGLGIWGMDWATTVLPHIPELDVVGWVDGNPGRLAELTAAQEAPSAPTFASMSDAIDATDPEAVIITAGIEAHYAVAREALAAGRHVLLEKPFVVEVEHADELIRLAEERDLVLTIAQNYRFWPAAAEAARLIRDGVVGELLNARVTFRRNHGDYPPSQNAPAGSPTSSILYQISVHHFDLIRYLLGEIADVDARRWVKGNMAGRTLTAFSATLTLENGLLVEYSGNQTSLAPETHWSGFWEVEGERGSLLWGSNAPGVEAEPVLLLRRESEPSQPLEIPALPQTDRHAVVLDFFRSVRDGHRSGIQAQENIKTLRAVDLTTRSLARDLVSIPKDAVSVG